jgi:hypothetical protein
MVANLRAGNIDGFLGPDPFNQRAVFDEVGFIHMLTKDLWNGHPCCAFGTSTEFIRQNPNTFAALFRSVLTAAAMARQPKNRELIAKVIAPQAYLNQPETVIAQVLTGKFADGLGKIQNVPDRADFDPMPWQSMAVWMLTQMQRWGYVKGEVDYKTSYKVDFGSESILNLGELHSANKFLERMYELAQAGGTTEKKPKCEMLNLPSMNVARKVLSARTKLTPVDDQMKPVPCEEAVHPPTRQ